MLAEPPRGPPPTKGVRSQVKGFKVQGFYAGLKKFPPAGSRRAETLVCGSKCHPVLQKTESSVMSDSDTLLGSGSLAGLCQSQADDGYPKVFRYVNPALSNI